MWFTFEMLRVSEEHLREKILIGVRATKVAGVTAKPVGVTPKNMGNSDFISLKIQCNLQFEGKV